MAIVQKKRKAEPLRSPRSVQGIVLDSGVVKKIGMDVYSIRFQRKVRAFSTKNDKLLPLFAD